MDLQGFRLREISQAEKGKGKYDLTYIRNLKNKINE